MKIFPVEAELFHAGGWTDGRTGGDNEAKSHSSQFCDSALKLFTEASMRMSVACYGLFAPYKYVP